mmetsp:Transcript_18975/g.27699  ORF Transcript_18975/g.27699 Transcript_18975/m.27699 type:complete len:537 (+) Transcript_18975:70-1680(+)|eukprot:CAMPEP_0197243580 /NCGR_PEP_ID=MMETSP1429-20130617/8988_1 /TAXON_ID=49237 /ORGANISM="Chaetoceros  sp., Strain UNC1202" /LENGTH=536 /DNA_ID=CAMNT_0042703827 /DNA_START=22 /DNA_END=1632 /DNA_ORIENTATION=+
MNETSTRSDSIVSYDDLVSAVNSDPFPTGISSDLLQVSDGFRQSMAGSRQEYFKTSPLNKNMSALSNTKSTGTTESSGTASNQKATNDMIGSPCSWYHPIIACAILECGASDADVNNNHKQIENMEEPFGTLDTVNKSLAASTISMDSILVNRKDLDEQSSTRQALRVPGTVEALGRNDSFPNLKIARDRLNSYSFQETKYTAHNIGSASDSELNGSFESEAEYNNAPVLYRLIERKEWDKVIRRVRLRPEEASVWVYSHCTKYTISWRITPLHAACIFGATFHVISEIIAAYPESVNFVDKGGKLPLHLACNACFSAETVSELIRVSPHTIHVPDRRGIRPINLALMSKGPARDQVLAILDLGLLPRNFQTSPVNRKPTRDEKIRSLLKKSKSIFLRNIAKTFILKAKNAAKKKIILEEKITTHEQVFVEDKQTPEKESINLLFLRKFIFKAKDAAKTNSILEEKPAVEETTIVEEKATLEEEVIVDKISTTEETDSVEEIPFKCCFLHMFDNNKLEAAPVENTKVEEQYFVEEE